MMPHEPDEPLLEYETEKHDGPMFPEPVPVRACEPVVTVETVPQHASTYTLVLTDDQSIVQLVGQDPLRTTLTAVSLDEDVVVCHSYQQAQDAANADTTLANPAGAVLTATVPLVLHTTQELWVVGNTFPSRVSVVIERRTA